MFTAGRSLALAVAFALGFAASAHAQTWPSKQPIKVVIPLSAGSATDVVPRIVFDQVGQQINQAFVVENRVGVAGTLGAAAVARAAPDGYTLLATSSSQTVYPATFSNLPFDVLNDFIYVMPLANVPTALVVSPTKGYKSVNDLVAAAKANPGALNFASAGVGNSTHFAAERFNLSADIKTVHIPFKGAPEALTEVMADRVDYYFSPLPPALSLAKDGKVQILAVGSATRSSALPDVPTTIEAGYPNSNYEFWVGVMLPKGTPPEIVSRLYDETKKALDNPAVQAKLRPLGADPMPMSTADFTSYVAKEVESNRAIAKAAGMALN